MRVALSPVLTIAVVVFAGMLIPSRCNASDAKSLVGVWQTQQVFPRLGEATVTCTLSSQGTFRLEARPAAAFPRSPLSISGKYLTYRETVKLIVTTPPIRAFNCSYYVSGDTLTLFLGPRGVVRLRRNCTTI